MKEMSENETTNQNAGAMTPDSEVPTTPSPVSVAPQGEVSNAAPGTVVDNSTVVPNDSYKSMVKHTLTAMEADFNLMRNNAKSEPIKESWLKGIHDLKKAHESITKALDEDLATRVNDTVSGKEVSNG